jgi:hypothetical protein
MFWISLLTACFHGPPNGPTPAEQASKIHTPLLVVSNGSHIGFSLLVRGGSAADPLGKEGVGSLLWQSLSEGADVEAFRTAGGRFRSEWHRDYGVLHYRWATEKDMSNALLEILEAQLFIDWSQEEREIALRQHIEAQDTTDDDRGLPSTLDAWLQLGLTGHPYAHAPTGTWASRAHLSTADLATAANRMFCAGNFHVAVSAKDKPGIPKTIENLLNTKGTCTQEPPTPKPFPLAQGPQLLILQSRGAGTHAFAGLPHRSTSHKTTNEDLAWGAALLAGATGNGPLQRALDLGDIEASLKIRVFQKGERWEQPLIMVNVRSQDADPVAMFDAITKTLMNIDFSGWTARDHHRLNKHLDKAIPQARTQVRLESQLLTEVFGPSPAAGFQEDASPTLEALQEGIRTQRLALVMEVSESEVLAEHASKQGFQVQVLSAEDFIRPSQADQ